MKRKYLIILIFCLIIIVLTSCKVMKDKYNIETIKRNVSISIVDNSLTARGVKLILKNNSNVDIHYGNPYEIEVNKNEKWQKLETELNFTLPLYSLKPKQQIELILDWENGYGKLENGKYRIIKKIDVKQDNDDKYDTFDVIVEFDI